MAHLLDEYGDEIVIKKGKSAKITGSFVDENGGPIAETALLTFTMTLFDKNTKTIINSRNAQDVKDVNGGTVNTDGTFEIKLTLMDNVIVAGTPADNYIETHIVRFEWTWNDGVNTRHGGNEFEFEVINWVTPS